MTNFCHEILYNLDVGFNLYEFLGFASVGIDSSTQMQPASISATSSQMVPMYNPAQPIVSSNAMYSQSPALQYSPVVHHWFYCKNVNDQPTWLPFSYRDSMALEDSFLNGKSMYNSIC